MQVYQEVLSVSTRKSINICEREAHGFIYEPICDNIYVYMYIYMYIYICINIYSCEQCMYTQRF